MSAEKNEDLNPANRVMIFDTTLRDGEQSPGIALSIDEKVVIAKQLGKLGVDVIEAGFPVNSDNEFKAVEAIAQAVDGPVIAGLARANNHDITKAAEAVKDAQKPRIHTFISTSDIHIINQLKTDREDVKVQARAAVATAKSFVDDVEFSPMDATRSDQEYTAEVVQIAIDEGATVINIPDTVGYATPEEYRKFIEFLRKNVGGSEDVTWSVHCHEDLGLAVANSYAGVLGGARQIEGSINGIGERAGNVALEEIIMLIETRGDDLYTSINTAQIGPTSRLVSRITGYPVPANKAVVGRNAFSHESGIHQDGVLKARETYEVMDPEKVGWKGEQIVIGKHTGRHGVVGFLENQPGFDKEAINYTFDLFKGFGEKVERVTAEQLIEIHEEAKRRLVADFEFGDHEIESRGNYDRARIIVVDKNAKIKVQTEAESDPDQREIDGPVGAVLTAVQNATNTNYKIEEVSHESIGKGKSAIDKARVEIRINGETVIGHGLSTNSLKAAACAYIDAVTRAKRKKS